MNNIFILLVEFSDILADFEIKRIFETKNTVLGRVGYLFQLKQKIAYLLTDLADQEIGWLYIDNTKIQLGRSEIKKIQSLIRLSNIELIKLRSKDFVIYSQEIARAMKKRITVSPQLEKGSSHMAFAPKNYTRFSENVLFDFNYRYPEQEVVEIIENFDELYQNSIQPMLGTLYRGRKWDDDVLYRYLTEFMSYNKQSINGQIYLPTLFEKIFDHFRSYDYERIALDLGPKMMIIRTNEPLSDIFIPSYNVKRKEIENRNYQVIEFTNILLDELFENTG